MDLLARVGIVAVVVVVFLSLILFVSAPRSAQPLNKTQAVQAVLNDVKANNTNALIGVVYVSNSTAEANSWQVVLSVVYNGTKPCPTLMIEGFDYPATGFVPTQSNLYTRGCIIYGISSAPSYVISSPYIAVARSYNSMYAPLVNYVNSFGYNYVNTSARFYQNVSPSFTPLNRSFSNVWIINYTASGAPYRQYAVFSQSGSALGNYTN